MFKSIWGAISGKMESIMEDTTDALPSTQTVSFQSKNIPTNITLKPSSDLKSIQVAYRISSNQPNTVTPPNISFDNSNETLSLSYNTKDNKMAEGANVSVGSINSFPLLIDAIVFVPEKLIPNFKLKLDVGSGKLNTAGVPMKSMNGDTTKDITYSEVEGHTIQLNSTTGVFVRKHDAESQNATFGLVLKDGNPRMDIV
ncbi:hypothetical protein BC833DRAFT_586703 [Globomyces pollinis-pini]|nr:hypothetical protein BC833DRAFT_586703 [Globomyces pollinis-pini]